MKIKRRDLMGHFYEFEDYVKANCCPPIPAKIHCSSVYFGDCGWYLSWDNSASAEVVLEQLNRLLGLDLELED